jgi:hypothetical protein
MQPRAKAVFDVLVPFDTDHMAVTIKLIGCTAGSRSRSPSFGSDLSRKAALTGRSGDAPRSMGRSRLASRDRRWQALQD